MGPLEPWGMGPHGVTQAQEPQHPQGTVGSWQGHLLRATSDDLPREGLLGETSLTSKWSWGLFSLKEQLVACFSRSPYPGLAGKTHRGSKSDLQQNSASTNKLALEGRRRPERRCREILLG